MDGDLRDVDGVTEVPEAAAHAPVIAEAPPPDPIRGYIRYGIWAVLLTLGALWFLSRERSLLGYLIIAELLALALEPAVIWMHDKHGWRRGSATGLLLGALLLAFLVLGVGIVSVLARETDQIVQDLPRYMGKLNSFTQQHFSSTVFSSAQITEAGDASTHINQYLKEHQADILGGLASALSSIFTLFTVGLFTFYLTAQGPQVRRALLSRLPPHKQQRALFAWDTAIKKMGGYLYSRLLLAAINGGLMFVTLKILGVPFAVPLALLSGLIAEFIPIVGTYVGGTLPVVVALAEKGSTVAIIVLIEIVIYQQVENYLLSPRISAKTIELNPGVAFGAAMAGGAVGGFVGAFFALPVAATIQAFLGSYSRTYEVADSELTRVDARPEPPPKEPRRRPRLHRGGSSERDDAPRS